MLGRFRIPTWVLVLLVPPGVCLLLFGLIVIVERWPSYLTLDLPTPSGGAWFYTSYTTKVSGGGQSGETGRWYLWRREIVYSEYGRGTRSTTAQEQFLIDHFDRYLKPQGWQRVGTNELPACRSLIPETEFLPKGTNGCLMYRQTNAIPRIGPTIAVAFWTNSQAAPIVFTIVLVTEKPSVLTDFGEAVD